MPSGEIKEIRRTGINASPGICIGKAYLVDKGRVEVVEKYTVEKEQIKEEVNRFRAAVTGAKDELRGIIDNAPEDLRQHINILETHVELLKDKMLYGKAIDIIETEQVNA
ncbi:MAG: phosphoenolpyruvate-utilizing N-terminal domain-containing protein, partial [Desulfobacterales bacterium]